MCSGALVSPPGPAQRELIDVSLEWKPHPEQRFCKLFLLVRHRNASARRASQSNQLAGGPVRSSGLAQCRPLHPRERAESSRIAPDGLALIGVEQRRFDIVKMSNACRF